MSTHDEALDELYAAFAHCRPTDPVPYCTCGCNREFAKRIEALPHAEVRTLDHRIIDYLAGTLIWTVGDCSTLRFVLPRLLELSWDVPTAEGVFKRIMDCGFVHWPERERRAVIAFVEAQWLIWFENKDEMYLYGFESELVDMSTAIHDDWQTRLHNLIARGSDSSQLRLLWLVDFAMNHPSFVEWDTLSRWLQEAAILDVLRAALARDNLDERYSRMQAKIKNSGIA